MSKLLFEMHSGISGDMILGALFDLGLNFKDWEKKIETLGLPMVSVKPEKISEHGISATRVTISGPREEKFRNLSSIREIIAKANLPRLTEDRTLSIFSNLAEAEARVHGCDVQSVHFHEIGAVDTIIDVVGACVGFEMLGVDAFYATPFVFGCGETQGSHGVLPVPVPATLELAKGFPAVRTGICEELSTPTGTAIITTLADPHQKITDHIHVSAGYGSGTKKINGRPNILRLSLMEAAPDARAARDEGQVFQLECNFDDLSPEVLAYLTKRLLKNGCLDVWQESIYMKKNRAGIKLCILTKSENLQDVSIIIARETTTGGIRYFPVDRIIGKKSSGVINTKYGDVHIKKIHFEEKYGDITKFAPEYESCKRISDEKGIPLQRVFSETISKLEKEDYGSLFTDEHRA